MSVLKDSSLILLLLSSCRDPHGGSTDREEAAEQDGGDTPSDTTETATPIGPWTDIELNGNTSCGIKDGEVLCWGTDAALADAIGSEDAKDLALGSDFLCVLDQESQVRCVGDLDGWPALPEGELVTTIEAGCYHVCGLTPDGRLQCWGNEGDGWDAIPTDGTWATFSTHNSVTCGISAADGSVHCWGVPSELPDGEPEGAFVDVANAVSYACVLDDSGAPTCWGRLVTLTGDALPEPDPGPFVRLYAGENLICGIREDGTTACWGHEEWLTLAGAPPDLPLVKLDAGLHLCGITLDHGVACWGDDTVGQSSPPM